MRRKAGLFLIFGAALPLLVASTAWACGVLATLRLDKKVAAPGETIAATGKNYSANGSEVAIRLKSRNSGAIKTVAPPAAGRLNTTFTVPENLSPGWYTVLATQNSSPTSTTPKSGTPGRTTLRVAAPGGRSGAAVAPWSSSKPSGPAASAAPVTGDAGGSLTVPMILAIVLSLTMLGAGWVFVGRRSGAVSRPQLG